MAAPPSIPDNRFISFDNPIAYGSKSNPVFGDVDVDGDLQTYETATAAAYYNPKPSSRRSSQIREASLNTTPTTEYAIASDHSQAVESYGFEGSDYAVASNPVYYARTSAKPNQQEVNYAIASNTPMMPTYAVSAKSGSVSSRAEVNYAIATSVPEPEIISRRNSRGVTSNTSYEDSTDLAKPEPSKKKGKGSVSVPPSGFSEPTYQLASDSVANQAMYEMPVGSPDNGHYHYASAASGQVAYQPVSTYRQGEVVYQVASDTQQSPYYAMSRAGEPTYHLARGQKPHEAVYQLASDAVYSHAVDLNSVDELGVPYSSADGL